MKPVSAITRWLMLGMLWLGLLPTSHAIAPATAAPRSAPEYLYTGEQIDPDLGMYYLRARYYQPATGRFWTMDSYEGSSETTISLHKYLYGSGNPVNNTDPSGHESLGSINVSMSIGSSLQSFHSEAVQQMGESIKSRLANFSAYISMMGDDASEEFLEVFAAEALPLIVTDEDYTPTDIDQQEPMCFRAGTLVLTERGKRPIESIKAGELVWAYDLASSNRVLKPVLQTFTRQRQDWFQIQVNAEWIKVTAEHPFYVLSKGWTRASELRQGDKLLAFLVGKNVTVGRVEKVPGIVVVHNFEVEGLHDYFVTEEGVLVHNNALHHFVTIALGSKVRRGAEMLRAAAPLSKFAHYVLHKRLDAFLLTKTKVINGITVTMRACKGNRWEVVRVNFVRQSVCEP